MAEPKDSEKTKGQAKPKAKPAAKPKAKAKPKTAAKPDSAATKTTAKSDTAAKPKTTAKAKTAAKPKAAAKPAAKPKTPAKSKARAGATAKAKAKPKEPAKPVAPPVVRASARYVRTAPRKVRLVADQVRGMQIDDARSMLRFSPRGAAEDLIKLLDSAAANAENNHDLIADDLLISEIIVNEGPTLRRFRPRALGRATPINKRTSHISVALTPEED